MKEALCFDDVLMVPKFSYVRSRTSVSLRSHLGRGERKLELAFPIIPANMATISESAMCDSITAIGGIGLLHRFKSITWTLEEYKNCNTHYGNQAIEYFKFRSFVR